MVFFTCNFCGESLKKSQVDKHYRLKCRQCEVLTCVDCHQDFPGDSYLQHVKCITEDQKYSAKGAKIKENKGEKKQMQWIENLQNLIRNKDERNLRIEPRVENILDGIMQHDNIPRKRAKFVNFVKNINRGVKPADIEATWDIFELALKHNNKSKNDESGDNKNKQEASKSELIDPDEAKNENKAEGKKSKADESDDDHVNGGSMDNDDDDCRHGVKMFKGTKADEKSKERKRKTENVVAENGSKKRKMEVQTDENSSSKFDWNSAIRGLLAKKGGEMKLQRLKKKVVAEYVNSCGNSAQKSEQELMLKAEKRIAKKFKVLKGVVKVNQ